MLQLFLNDLSFAADECEKQVAILRLRRLVTALRAIRSHDDQFVLNGPHSLNDLQLAPNWPLFKLRNEGNCSDENLYLKTVESRFPFGQAVIALEGPPQEGLEYRLTEQATVCSGEVAVGLGLSHQFDGLALSISSHPYWDETAIALQRLEMNDDTGIDEVLVSACNCTSQDTVATHLQALQVARLALVPTGLALWAQREELFPNLKFIPRTRTQIEIYEQGDPILASVIDRLFGLNRAIGLWKDQSSDHPSYPFNVRPESRKRQSLVYFNDAGGTSRCFSDHADFAPSEGRLHFLLQTEPDRHALVGHIGKKLGIG